MNGLIGSLVAKIAVDSTELVTGLKKGSAAVGDFSSKLTNLGTGMAKIGAGLSAAITAPIAGFGIAAGKSMMDFDQAMTNSLSIMGKVTPEIRKQMEDQAKFLSEKLPISAAKMAESYYFLASAGMSAAEAMENLPVVANLAVGGGFDMSKATELLNDSNNAMKRSRSQMAELAEMMSQASNLSATNVEQIASGLASGAGGSFAQFGIDAKEGIAALMAFADAGRKGSEGGTLLSSAITYLTTKSLENAAVFKKYNVEVFDPVTKKFIGIAAAARKFEAAMQGKGTQDRIKMLNDLGLAGADSIKGMSALIGISSKIDDYRGRLGEVGATAAMVEVQCKSFYSQLSLLRNMFDNLGSSIAETLIPELQRVIGFVKDILTHLKTLSPETKKTIAIIAMVAAAIGPAAMGLGTLSMGIGGVILGISILVAATPEILACAAAIGGLCLGLQALGEFMGVDIFGPFFDTFKAKSYSSLSAFQEMISKVADRIQMFVIVIKTYFEIVWTTLDISVNNVVMALGWMIEYVALVGETLWKESSAMWSGFADLARAAFQDVIASGSVMMSNLKALLTGGELKSIPIGENLAGAFLNSNIGKASEDYVQRAPEIKDRYLSMVRDYPKEWAAIANKNGNVAPWSNYIDDLFKMFKTVPKAAAAVPVPTPVAPAATPVAPAGSPSPVTPNALTTIESKFASAAEMGSQEALRVMKSHLFTFSESQDPAKETAQNTDIIATGVTTISAKFSELTNQFGRIQAI